MEVNAMKQDLSKICADTLRAYTNEKYNIKLKATHAHELVAAYFGYSSKNALLADTKYPISNLHQAEIIVMAPDDAIDQRRKKLQGLPEELPDSHTLGEEVYNSLFSDSSWQSIYPIFSSFDKAATYIAELYHPLINKFFKNGNHPFHLIVDKKNNEDSVSLIVNYTYKNLSEEMECSRITTIHLPRVAGYIGYGKPDVYMQKFGPGTRRTLESLGVHYE